MRKQILLNFFELYLNRYAQKAGDIINHYIPSGSHPDMEPYLYAPFA